MPDDLNNNAKENEAGAAPDAPGAGTVPPADANAKPAGGPDVAPTPGPDVIPAADANAKPADGPDLPPAPGPDVIPPAGANAKPPADVSGGADAKGNQGNGGGAGGGGGNGGTPSGPAPVVSSHPFPARDKIFTWLTVGQYAVLGAIGVIIVLYLFGSLLSNNAATFLYSLSKPEVARGVITFLVAAGTVSLAVLLVMAAIMSGSKDLDQRFGFGKEVLTLLIGILGTIVGFYYGSAKENPTPLTLSPVAISASTLAPNDTFTLDTLVIGGAPPYTYSIKFKPEDFFQDLSDQTSEGPIHYEFHIPTTVRTTVPEQPLTFTLEVKDAKNQSITYNKDGAQKITLKAASGSGAASPTSPTNPASPTPPAGR